MVLKPKGINFQPVSPENEIRIFSNFVDTSGIGRDITDFCVDGRKGNRKKGKEYTNEPYVQTLGGSLHSVVLNWILVCPTEKFDTVTKNTLDALREKGYRIGLHNGPHADNQEKSDCGFADNLGSIINILKENEKEIWKTLVEAAPFLSIDSNLWKEVIDSLKQVDVENLPKGHDIIYENNQSADFQTLEGDHKEIAAVVNTQPNTTLDVDTNQDTQAFNLDLWYVLEQAKELGINEVKAKLLSLGLYAATEKVLVERNRGIRIPIIVR